MCSPIDIYHNRIPEVIHLVTAVLPVIPHTGNDTREVRIWLTETIICSVNHQYALHLVRCSEIDGPPGVQVAGFRNAASGRIG